MAAKIFGQRLLVFLEYKVGIVIEHSRGGGVHTRKHRRARRITQRELAVGMLESDAPSSQAIDVRRDRYRVAEATDPAIEIIRHNKEHVGSSVLKRWN